MSAADEAALDDEQREILRAPDSRMGAYYYWFDRTGEPAIDAILSAVAYAGKAFHGTEDWDLTDVNYGPIRGDMSAVDVIQAAANEAARQLSHPAPAEQAWREGYDTGKRDYAGSVMGGASITTENPYLTIEGQDQ